MKLLSYKGILFDDWCDETEDGERRIWAEMCKEHAEKYKELLQIELDDGGTAQGCCSIYECEANGHDSEKSHYYVDFNVLLVKFVEKEEFACTK